MLNFSNVFAQGGDYQISVTNTTSMMINSCDIMKVSKNVITI